MLKLTVLLNGLWIARSRMPMSIAWLSSARVVMCRIKFL